MNPIIGITTSGRHEHEIHSKYYSEYFAVPADYVDAVRRAGGIPVLLPPGETNLAELIAHVDGVIVTGGADVHPTEYGGDAAHPALSSRMDRERDAFDLSLARLLSEDAGHPSLFVCRGMQALNVALGGTLHEHIPDVRDGDIHRGEGGGWAVQPVMVKDGSFLAQAMGTTAAATYSGHHQAAKDVAPGLEIVATAPDGIVEALAKSDHPWLIAVQWHPEKSAASDPTQQAIFDNLVQAAAARRARRQG